MQIVQQQVRKARKDQLGQKARKGHPDLQDHLGLKEKEGEVDQWALLARVGPLEHRAPLGHKELLGPPVQMGNHLIYEIFLH